MNRTSTYVAAIGLSLSWTLAQGAEREATPEPPATLWEQVRSDDYRVRSAALSRLVPQRSEAIGALKCIVEGSLDFPGRDRYKAEAIELLGEYRASEAVRVLVEEIECPCQFDSFPNFFFGYASPKALLKIGEPAIKEILTRRMARPVSQKQLKIFAYVVWLHYGVEEEVGLFRMRRLLEKEKASRMEEAEKRGQELGPSTKEENLARLIEVYHAINPKDPKDWPGTWKKRSEAVK
jgi:hypothetical protein